MQAGLLFLILVLGFCGCAAPQEMTPAERTVAKTETPKDIQAAVSAVAGAVTNRGVIVRYCPKCGRRYSSKVQVCPQDQTPLRDVEE